MQKKIIILGHAPLPPEHPDCGKVIRHPGRWVFDQAKAVSDHSDYKVTLVTLVKGATQDFEFFYGELHVVYLKAQPKLRERTCFLWDVMRLRKRVLEEQPDLVHAHGTEDAYGLTLLTLAVPKVLTVQGLYHDVNRTMPASFLSPPYVLEKLEGFVLKRFHHAVVKSRHVEQVTKGFFPHLNLDVIPNTLSELFINVEKAEKDVRKLAFVGAILPRKGFHHIREALELGDKELPLELHVFGDSSNRDFIAHEVELIRQAGHQVILHGNVDAGTLLRGLVTCNLLIAPSHAETFGNQVIEGMLCRCHCIVSDGTGMAENVRKYGQGSVVPQKSGKKIADAIKQELARGVGAEVMSERELARSKILAELGPVMIANRLCEMYSRKLL